MAKKPAAKKRSTTKRQYDDILYEVKDQVAWVDHQPAARAQRVPRADPR